MSIQRNLLAPQITRALLELGFNTTIETIEAKLSDMIKLGVTNQFFSVHNESG